MMRIHMIIAMYLDGICIGKNRLRAWSIFLFAKNLLDILWKGVFG